VLLGEPQRTPWDLSFSLFGIPVRIHPFFWLVALLLGANSRDAMDILTWVVALLVSILFHELGHALALRAFGAHSWIVLYGLGGITAHNPAQARYSRGSGSLSQILVSLAGPGAGFLLAGVIAAAVVLSGHRVQVLVGAPFGLLVLVPAGETIASPQFTELIQQLLFINVLWGIVNLLPVYPLDGGQIAREVLVAVNPRAGIQQSLMLSALTATALAVVGLALWKSPFVTLLFGYLAYSSYMALQAYNRRGPW